MTESKMEAIFDKVDGDKSGTIKYGKFKEVQFIDMTRTIVQPDER